MYGVGLVELEVKKLELTEAFGDTGVDRLSLVLESHGQFGQQC